VTSVISRFLEATSKYKAVEWEPRYNLSPIAFSDVAIVRNAKAPDAPKGAPAPAPAPAKEKQQPAPK
jgi:hypothetical protein